jgi:hypothetical protein
MWGLRTFPQFFAFFFALVNGDAREQVGFTESFKADVMQIPPPGQEVFPECDCSCCTAEKCPCSASGKGSCSEDVICFTDKRPECHEWVGQNLEANFCNVQRTWQQWRNANPYDVRYADPKVRMKHDFFCRDFCTAEMPLPGKRCLAVPLPSPKPTLEPCPGHCVCSGTTTTTPAPLPPFLLQSAERRIAAGKSSQTQGGLRRRVTLLRSSRAEDPACKACPCNMDNAP